MCGVCVCGVRTQVETGKQKRRRGEIIYITTVQVKVPFTLLSNGNQHNLIILIYQKSKKEK